MKWQKSAIPKASEAFSRLTPYTEQVYMCSLYGINPRNPSDAFGTAAMLPYPPAPSQNARRPTHTAAPPRPPRHTRAAYQGTRRTPPRGRMLPLYPSKHNACSRTPPPRSPRAPLCHSAHNAPAVPGWKLITYQGRDCGIALYLCALR